MTDKTALPPTPRNDEELPGMLAVAKGVAEQRWPHTMDAKIWADEFVKLNPGADHGLMLGWFANAIMAGYDTAQARAVRSETLRREISAGGAYELKLYGTPGYVGTIAGITISADPEVPEHTVILKDELGRELGRIINVGR